MWVSNMRQKQLLRCPLESADAFFNAFSTAFSWAAHIFGLVEKHPEPSDPFSPSGSVTFNGLSFTNA